MSLKKMNTSKSTVRITVLFNMCKKAYFKGTSCKTIEWKFILKQKCLAGGDEYGIMIAIKENFQFAKRIS